MQCYSAEELFSIYHVDENDGFKMNRFESLSIALLDQIESNVCESGDNDDVGEDDDENEKMTNMTGEWASSSLISASMHLCTGKV